MTPRGFELAVLERFRTLFPRPQFEVRHDLRLHGAASGAMRQIDLAVFEPGEATPILIIEVKRRNRPIDLVSSGATIALVRDVNIAPAVMVSTAGFSGAAERYLLWEGIEHMTVTVQEAMGLRWIPHIEQWFGLDRWFREVSGHLFEAMRVVNVEPFLDTDIPYEEWLAVTHAGLSLFPQATTRLLHHLAMSHVESGTRFNAIQLLSDGEYLDIARARRLRMAEYDEDVCELLDDLIAREAAT